jgi:small ligand-binding sensory domain FIST
MVAGDETQTRPAGAHAGRAAAAAGGAAASAIVQSGPTWDVATEAVLAGLDPAEQADLGLVFIDSRFAAHYGDVLARLREGSGVRHLVGASGQGVIGPSIEAEAQPAVSLLTLTLPKLEATTIRIASSEEVEAAFERLGAARPQAWLLFVDPFRVDAEALVGAIEERSPGTPLLGGMASAHNLQAGTAVFADGEVQAGGAVLVGLRGSFGLHTVVAQGAEPIGQPWTITACAGNVVHELGSRPAIAVLQQTLAALDAATRERAQRNLLVGLAMDEYRHHHGRGDYLVRNVLSGDRESGSIAINAIPRLGQTFQFQFRDAAAADEDLRDHLELFKSRLLPGETVFGAVVCACNGRGQGLFGVPHHDAQALAEALGPIPSAGLFCSGEIGPVAGATYLHGFTASIALLTARGR